MDERFELLKKLIQLYPDAFIKVGEEMIPTRKELWTFDLYRKLFERDTFKTHLEIPIILTLDREYSTIIKLFHNRLICKNEIKYIDLSLEDQLLMITFLDSIMTTKELYNFLYIDRGNYGSNYKLFSLEIWIRLMDLTFNVEFIQKDERIRLCYAIYRNSYDDSSDSDNHYRKILATENKETIFRRNPYFEKALKYYKVEYSDVLKAHQPRPEYRGGGYAN